MSSYLTQLKSAESLKELAGIVRFEPKKLSYILYKIPEKDKYQPFKIPKKTGGERHIQAPRPELKTLQKRVKNILYICCDELEKSNIKTLSHGFKKKYSIHTNAGIHKNRRYVLNFDIKDFFPSINFGRVRGYFIKNKDFELNEKTATVIAQIACHDNQLPQGSPCSPVISNLIAHLLDMRLVQIAKKYKLSYSRYADDITLSTHKKTFPKEVAFQNLEDPENWRLGDIVKKTVSACGFEVHPEKTRMRYKDFRQTVTGLVVNKKVNVRSEYYRRARAMAHSLFTKGQYTVPAKSSPVDILDPSCPPQEEKDPKRLEGILNHIFYTRNLSDKRELRDKQEKSTVVWRLYKDLLFFKNFIAPEKPVIICEGPTDSIYIKLALKKFVNEYPSLIKKTGDKINYEVRFLDRSKKDAGQILQLSGGNKKNPSEGSGGLLTFLGEYEKNFKKYPAWKQAKQPVILLIDNDDGAKSIFNSIKNNHKKIVSMEEDEPFVFIYENLYLIKTPHINGKTKTCIEDLFDQNWLKNIKWNEKTFSGEEAFDIDNFYGKKYLATKVIPQNLSSVDFNNFKKLLDRLGKVIEDYDMRKKSEEKAGEKEASEETMKILEILNVNPKATIPELVRQTAKSESAVWRIIKKFQNEGYLKRVGPDKGGHWEVMKTRES